MHEKLVNEVHVKACQVNRWDIFMYHIEKNNNYQVRVFKMWV
ncbi:hypothetical protein VCHC46B1_2438 [Vibrio cholerae HC-46B1]|nr:hypothetical protein VCHC60A1_3697 [Vibrio cholerae HC-60A1]EKL95503.1 hypothetical protein VCHC46B1_2438 [Vibrio cholerae HC-46B1]EKM01856.1 hypothetical protein VCHC44C1_3588 [Vibrio cholerae HC-44C1]